MPRITNIQPLPQEGSGDNRLLIWVDGEPCVRVRARTWPAFGLTVGSEASCDELRERDAYHWKFQYQAVGAWDKEQYRVRRVRQAVETIEPRVAAKVVGFGTGDPRLLPFHPVEHGRPDIDVVVAATGEVVLSIEVTGTEQMRGTGLWLRPDKLEWAMRHPAAEVWYAFHYARPTERLLFWRPQEDSRHDIREEMIRYSVERYIEIPEHSQGVITAAAFGVHLRSRVDRLLGSR